jgi:ABC-type multidrug transport system ATPase subunit
MSDSSHILSLSLQRLDLLGADGVARAPLSARWPAGCAGVTGPDGCGKSTLLRMLAGERPVPRASVTLHLAGRTLAPGDADWPRHVFWCDPDASALDGLIAHAYLAHHRPRHPGWDDEALKAHLNAFQLVEHLDKPLYALSMGMRRKLRLAAAFASGAALTLLDEPWAALDLRSGRHVHTTLDGAARQRHRLWVVAAAELPLALDPVLALHMR